MSFRNLAGNFDDDDQSILKFDANLYLSFHHTVVVHVVLEQQCEQFTWVKTTVYAGRNHSWRIAVQLYEQFTQVETISGVL